VANRLRRHKIRDKLDSILVASGRIREHLFDIDVMANDESPSVKESVTMMITYISEFENMVKRIKDGT